MSHYITYYNDQIGGGGVRNVFTGSAYQRGRGVGSWLGGLLRRILPYVASGAKAVGKEAARAGLNVLDDVANKGVNFKEAVKLRTKESSKNLKKKAAVKIAEMMKGSGYKSRALRRRRQSRKTRVSGSVATARKRRKQVKKKRSTGIKRKRLQITVSKRRRKKKHQNTTNFRKITDIFGPQ